MDSIWPPLPLEEWKETYATLHRYTQIAGKVALALTPLENHFWNVAFHLTPRGLATRTIPYQGRTFDMEFDFLDHNFVIRVSDGARRGLALVPRAVADFYREVMAILGSLGIDVAINDHPVELLSEMIPFHADRMHAAYDPDAAQRCFRVLAESAVVLEEFRARFIGKCSPVHFFWGSFDLAVSRFSGRRAVVRANDSITRESYSHELVSAGFWPGDTRYPEPAYYCYSVPAPDGFAEAEVLPAAASWNTELGEFLLPYEAVRRSRTPRELLLAFLQTTYQAAADRAGWDRDALERHAPEPETRSPEAPLPI
ncbi:MAG: DUF5996 family protein [Polyangia bacterium]